MGECLVDANNDNAGEGVLLVLVKCPICGEQLADLDSTEEYSRDIDAHIATHDPEDLGLDGEYQFRPMADILIELHDLGRERKEAL